VAAVAWQYRRQKKLLPGVTLNLSKSGAGLSFGPRGAKVSVGPRGLGATATLLGTGLTFIWRQKKRS
jgi:hypothetical protein